MTKRICCFIDPATDTPCGAEAEWCLLGSNAVYEFVDSCTAHVGALLDDAPETRVTPIGGTVTEGSGCALCDVLNVPVDGIHTIKRGQFPCLRQQ